MTRRGVFKKGPGYNVADPMLYAGLSKAAIWDALCEQVALADTVAESADEVLANPTHLERLVRESIEPVLVARGDRMPKPRAR